MALIQEIIYTSAEKGLRQGSRGFCTVVSTAGLALNLAERLESMSGYRHAFPLHDPKASLNPVCYSHVTTRLAGKTLHVISRVADAGQDYTGRSNKLAHHIAIENVGSLSAGPARLLIHPGVVTARWDGEVRNIAPRELPPVPCPAEISLSAWKSLTGDHGWAGAVAEQMTQSAAPIHVLFDAGTNVMSLVQEVLDLLPVAQRWNATFCTYFTRLLAGTECQLRFVLNGTPEATVLRNDAKARVIDLTSPLPPATGGSKVSQARTGTIHPEIAAGENAAVFSELQSAARTRTPSQISAAAPVAGSTRPPLKPAVLNLGGSQSPAIPSLPNASTSRSRTRMWIVVAGVLLLVSVTAATFFLTGSGGPDKFSVLVSQTRSDNNSQISAEQTLLEQKRQADRAAEEQEKQKQAAARQAEQKAKDDQKRLALEETAKAELERQQLETQRRIAEEARIQNLRQEGPFAFLKSDPMRHDASGQWLFELPKPQPDETATPLPLRTAGETVTLTLAESARPLFQGNPLEVFLEPDDSTPNRWNVISKQGTVTAELGSYWIHKIEPPPSDAAEPDAELHFTWGPNASRELESSELARWSPLQVRVGNRMAVLLQRTAFQPGIAPGWNELLSNNKIVFTNSSEFKAILNAKHTTAVFRAELGGAGNDQVVMEVPLHGPIDQPQKEEDENDENDENETLETAFDVRYSQLTTPFHFTERPPEIDAQLLGLCVFRLNLKVEDAAGLTLQPQITLRLRLPKKDFAEDLPSPESINFLTSLRDSKTPEEVLRLLKQFNPERTDQVITQLQRNRENYFSTIGRWYTQPLRKLPAMSQWRLPFTELSEKACDAAKPIINEVARAIQNLKHAGSPIGKDLVAVEQFIPAMGTTEKEVRKTRETLMQHYDAIQGQIGALEANLRRAPPRFQVLGKVDTTGADNGNAVTIHFLDTQADTTR